MRMAADSDGSLTAVVICEGNLHDPEFPRKFRHLLAKLKHILQQPKRSKKLKVNKVEPWNSVRVTLSIPKDAAAKLRQLASEGSNALRALGILSVQLEGDTVISLRLVGHDLVLRTVSDNTTTGCVQEAGSSNTSLSDLSQILGSRIQQTTAGPSSCPSTPTIAPTASILESVPGPSHRNIIPQSPVVAAGIAGGGIGSTSGSSGSLPNPIIINGPTTPSFEKPPLFKSPNTVCPMDGKLPVPPLANIVETREYPFESMTQARVIQRRENTMAVVAALGSGAQPTVANASLNLNQGQQITPPPLAIPVAGSANDAVSQQPVQAVVKSPFMQPPPPPYPIASGTNTLKPSTHTMQHTLQQQSSSSISLSNGTNALSSPLLVNLLQNDGVNQMKVPSVASSVLLQQQQQQTSPATLMVPNLASHTQNDGVLLLNNSNNSNDSGSSISISPSIPVPSSSQTISNITSNAVTTPPVPAAVGASGAAVTTGSILNQNVMGASHQPATVTGVGIRVQQQRFSMPTAVQQQQAGVQQPNLAAQHQMIHGASSVPMPRFPSQQHQVLSGVNVMGGVTQSTFRHPQQQAQPQQVGMQPFVAPSPSPHPSLVNHPQPPPGQQVAANNFNHPRWPFKPMDSATKSSFQEFARYQLQYNLQQEMNSQTTSVSGIGRAPATAVSGSLQGTISIGNVTNSAGDKASNVGDALGLSSYLDELSKTDLDSLLLPGLGDLDSALDLDGKNALESLLDAKDLDLDLIDQDGATTVLQDSMSSCAVNPLEIGLPPPAPVVPPTTSSSTVVQQIQPPPPASLEKSRTAPVSSINITMNKEKCELTSSGKERQYLINPLTGELEPVPSEDESEMEEPTNDNIDVFNEMNSEMSNSLFSDDENSCSTAFSKASDHSDTERSSNSEASGRSRYSKPRKERRDGSSGSSHSSKKSKPSIKTNLLKEKLQQGIKDKMSGKSKQSKEKIMTKAKLIPIDGKDSPSEKIKLRLKLEKSEPVSPAYKVDISFVPSPKRAQSATNAGAMSQSNYSSSQSTQSTANSSAGVNQNQQNAVQSLASSNSSNQSPHSEEPRVPPLHISLRGKNSIVIKNSKKDRKKSQSGGEEDESYLKKMQIKRNNNLFEEQNVVSRYVVTNDHLQFSNNASMKSSGQGKPITRIPSSDDYPGSNSYSKAVVENGEDSEKGFLTSKRVAMEAGTNPNGLISPETKRRRMSQSQEQQQQQVNNTTAGEKHVQETYNHMQGPIGSTNVGTLPAHSSLSKNQKVSNNNNNNSSNFISKLHKSSIKLGKPVVVVKHCKSPTTNPVKDPGKSPPTTGGQEHPPSQSQVNCQAPALLKTSISLSGSTSSPSTITKSTGSSGGSGSVVTKPQSETSGVTAQQKAVSKYSSIVCPLPQSSTEAMSKEKFKQKLLEFQGANDKEHVEKTTAANYVVNTSCTNNSNSAKAHEQIVQLSEMKTSTVPVTLLERRTQKSTAHVTEAAKSVASNTSSPAANSSTNSGDCRTHSSPHKDDLKEQCAIQEQQLRPPNQSQGSGGLEVGPNLLNNGEGNSNARNSPGSQAQGEDSGIESMDALSEKSPHQSASPQQGDTQPAHIPTKTVDIVHSKIEEKISIATDVKDEQEDEITNIRDIEAALAKMEGINEHFLTPCDSPMNKLNGEHAMKEESLLENLTDDKILLCASKLEQEEDLAAIMGGNSSGKSTPVLSPLLDVKDECRDLNENKEISSKISLETQLVDECCKKSLKPNIKHEDDTEISTQISSPHSPKEKKFEENVIETASSLNETEAKVAENIKVESAVVKEEAVNAGLAPNMSVATSSPLDGDVISDANDKSFVDIKEILTPITIEIPTHPESEVPRVRTRASSKLESPLDAPKQSPQLDSPATITNPKSNLKLSVSAVDRLSPKVSIGKSGACAGGIVSIGSKRKRQGSESSTQSCVSDDTSGRNSGASSSLAKRSRPNSLNSTAHSGHEGNTTKSSKPGSNVGAGQKKQSSSKVKKPHDDSSDSDEPLIEVAGKVRSGKESVGKPPSSEEKTDNKVLRNHRTPSQHSRTSAHSTASATSAANHQTTGPNSTASKTSRGAQGLHTNSVSSGGGTSATAVSNGSSNSIASNNTHCTRASSGVSGANASMTTSVATAAVSNSTSGSSSTTHSSNNSSTGQPHNTTHDDKIGTRRSVRASAAANKIIYSRSGGPPNHNSNTTETSKTSGGASHKNVSNTPSADNSEPRRKTRSAAGGETTEGRRRRGSRDSK